MDWQGLNQITLRTRYIINNYTFTNYLYVFTSLYLPVGKSVIIFIINSVYHAGKEYSHLTAIHIFYFLQVTISYGEFKVVNKPVIKNLVNIPNAVFDEEEDPTR